jgi:hypothetical protein
MMHNCLELCGAVPRAVHCFQAQPGTVQCCTKAVQRLCINIQRCVQYAGSADYMQNLCWEGYTKLMQSCAEVLLSLCRVLLSWFYSTKLCRAVHNYTGSAGFVRTTLPSCATEPYVRCWLC